MFNLFNLLDVSATNDAVSQAAAAASDAVNSTAGANDSMSTYFQIGLIVLVIGAMYFFMIRPQKKKQKEEEKLRNNIIVGDEIVTIGGICGKIVSIKDDSLLIETGSDRVKMRIQKWSIQTNLTKHE